MDSLFLYRAKVLVFDQGKSNFRPPSINHEDNSSERFRTFQARLQMNRSQLQMHNKKLSVFASVSFSYLYNRGQIYTLPKKSFMKCLRARATPSAEETPPPPPPRDVSQAAVKIPLRADLAPQENLTMIKEPMRTETVTIVFVNLLQS